MKIAVAGLGRMGMQIARKLSEGGHEVAAHNRSPGPISEAAGYGAAAAPKKEDVVSFFGTSPVCLWLMVPANVVDRQLDEWLALLPKKSTIIDGGNSDFRLTKQRAARVSASGSELIDVGTSSGIWGYERGFSMMAGGEEESFRHIEPLLQTLSEPSGGYAHFGGSGSGHFVKMVHNAIEYGMMESLAEGYRILNEGPYKNLSLERAGAVWQQNSVITSWLNELCRQALAESPELEGIEGTVAESGEARWTLEVAQELGIDMPAIAAAFNVRLQSQQGKVNFSTKLLAAMRHKFGGHSLNN